MKLHIFGSLFLLLTITVSADAATTRRSVADRLEEVGREVRSRIDRVVRPIVRPLKPATTGDHVQPPLPKPCPAGQTC